MGQLLPNRVVLEVQQGKSGASPWKTLAVLATGEADVSTYSMAAIDSSELEITRLVGRDERTGGLVTIDSYRSGPVLSFTSELSVMDTKLATLLDTLDGINNMRLRYFTGDYGNPVNFERMRYMTRAWNKKPFGSFSREMLNSREGFDAPADPQLRVFPLEIDNVVELDPIIRQRVQGAATAQGFKHVLSIGYPRRAGTVSGETTNNPGNKEWLAIVGDDGSNLSHLFYTLDKWATVVDITLTGITNLEATAVAKAGDNIIVSGLDAVGGGLCYASWEDIKAATQTWTRSTGIAAGTVVNYVLAVSSTLVYACGAAGAVYVSYDGGRSFASAGTAVTANALSKIASAGEDLVWFGGASGTLVRMLKGVMSVITVTGLSTTAINSLAVPYAITRGEEVYVGGANGTVYKSVNGAATTPTWTTPYVLTGAIDGLAFAGYDSPVLGFIHTNGSSQSRILIDYSGGYFGNDVKVLGSYTSPANATLDHIAAADHKTFTAVGPASGSFGVIELVA